MEAAWKNRLRKAFIQPPSLLCFPLLGGGFVVLWLRCPWLGWLVGLLTDWVIAGAGSWLAGLGELVCLMVGLLGCLAVVMGGGLLAGCWVDGLLADWFAC